VLHDYALYKSTFTLLYFTLYADISDYLAIVIQTDFRLQQPQLVSCSIGAFSLEVTN